MVMTVSKGSGLAYIGVDFNFLKEHGRLDGSVFYIVRVRSLSDEDTDELYHDRDRTMSINIMLDRNGTGRRKRFGSSAPNITESGICSYIQRKR
jgi:hypothetical protein